MLARRIAKRRHGSSTCTAAWLATLCLLSTDSGNASASPLRAGDVFQIERRYVTENHSTDGSSGPSSGSDVVEIRVVSTDETGTIFELDHASGVDAASRERNWTYPARIWRPRNGPSQLLNGDELTGRLNAWLTRANWTREMCGRLLFTWNLFRIECDPASVLPEFDAWFPEDPVDGGDYQHPLALHTAQLTLLDNAQLGFSLAANLPMDAALAMSADRKTESTVVELLGREPHRRRVGRLIDGSIYVRYDVYPDGRGWRRSELVLRSTKSSDNIISSQAELTTLTRRRITGD